MKISIIIPTHNRVGLLYEAIDSVSRLNLDSCEVIVCDDGSTEDIESICSIFHERGLDIVFSRTEENSGAQVARNRGMKLAQGEFVLFLDSDDGLSTEGMPDLIAAFDKDPSLDYVYGKVVRANENLQARQRGQLVGEEYTDTPFEVAGYHWHTIGALYRSEFLKRVGPWNVAMTGSQDWEYQARVKLAGGKRKFVNTIVGYWRQKHRAERVGAIEFRPDYVESVMIACDVVLKLARERGYCDKALEKRLAKRLLVHALEWGANHHYKDRRMCLLQAKNSLSSSPFFKFSISLMIYTPSTIDKLLYWFITKDRNH
jgi:glycosyltransferase involved in cell wall biosynthesis